MQSKLNRVMSCAGALVMALMVAAPAQAFVTIYDNDFSTSVAEFNETTNAQWSLTGGGEYNNTIGVANTASLSTVHMAQLGGTPTTALDWRMSTRFVVNSVSGADSTVGLAALGTTAGLGSFYLGDVQFIDDDMRLFLINPNQQFVDQDAGFNLTIGTAYDLVFSGLYNDAGAIQLTLTLTDVATPTNTHTISAVDTPSAVNGEYFGFRDRTSGSAGTLNVDFDFLTIEAMPEPATLSLLGFGAMALLARRRRRA